MAASYSAFTEKLYAETRRRMADEEDRFERWSSYRCAITDLILKELGSGKTLAIFGAGNCNDIDLAVLREHGLEITLIDISKDAMRSALHRYHLENDAGIRLIRADLAGILEEDYKDFIEMLYRNMNRFTGERARFVEASIEALEYLRRRYSSAHARMHAELPFHGTIAEAVCAFGLHSQLNSLMSYFLAKVFIKTHNMNSYPDAVGSSIAQYSGNIAAEANSVILRASRNASLIGFDLTDEKARNPHAESEGSWQAMQDLLTNYNGKELTESFLWPFSEEHCYRMHVVKCVKNPGEAPITPPQS